MKQFFVSYLVMLVGMCFVLTQYIFEKREVIRQQQLAAKCERSVANVRQYLTAHGKAKLATLLEGK